MATEPLATITPPKLPETGKRVGFQEALGIQQPYMQRKGELLPQISSAEGDIARAKQAQTETLATGKEQAMQRFAGAERGAKEAYQERLEAEPLPAFVPTQDTVQDIAALFSLIGVIGMVAGKGNSMQAMNAMNGMLEGHQKGRKDLYRQERQTFEKNFQSMLKKHEEFRKEMEDAVKLASTDREAGMQAAEVAAAKAGSSIVQAQLRKGQLVDAYKFVEESQRGVENALNLEEKARAADAAERRHKETLAQQERLRTAQMAQTRELALIRAGGKDAKPPPKEIVAQNQLRNSLIPKIEEALPVLDRLQREGKWNTMTTLLAVDPRAAELQFRDDKEALNLVLTLAYFRSKEFETAGKALTRKEDQILAPIVRGDLRAYEGIKNAMEQGVKSLKQEQKGLEATYPFIREYNKALRGETEDSAPPAPGGKPMPTGDKLKAYADQHFGGDEDAARTYLQSQGYQ